MVVSGTPVRRPHGQFPVDDGDGPRLAYAPTRALDFEAEVGFVVGAGSSPGVPVPAEQVADHVFGRGPAQRLVGT